MTQQEILFSEVPLEKLSLLSREELVLLFKGEQNLRLQLAQENKKLRDLHELLKQRSFIVEEQLVTIKNKLYGKSSERSRKSNTRSINSQANKKKRILLPSERYPDAPLIEQHITLDVLPSCKCCGTEMQDSGMTEDSEFLTKVPAEYYVVVQMRHKYRCGGCHSDIQTAPLPPRIAPGGSYSDELIMDVAVSKYCDLIPIERQAKMAERAGLKGIPPQSLIESTHSFADLVRPAYVGCEEEFLASIVGHADETPHNMLEGDKKRSWYLWGFATEKTSYFEYHDSRSGDVASDLLIKSKCEYLVSDVYSGYSKAIKEVNRFRVENNLPQIKHVYCNAHARRYFKQAGESFPQEAKYYISQYRKIYRLEKLANKHPDKKEKIRLRLRKYFEKIKTKCLADVGGYSTKSGLGKAMNYFLKNYTGFTLFIGDVRLPIDNNPAERLLRSPVIGRKTWYGTHSKRGAETAAIIFTLVESCKLNEVNPREYFKNLAQDLLLGKQSYTPNQYKHLAKK